LRRAILVAAAVLALSLGVPAALADGDPASDYLLVNPVFVPPDDGIPPAYATQLTTVLARAKQQGYVIRVALIKTRYDMGSVTILYRRPKQYAHFLSQELHFVYAGRLLVVMPNGYGYARGGRLEPAQQAVVDRLAPPGTTGAQLAASATRAVRALAAASGVRVALPPLRGSTGTSTTRDRVVIGGVAVVVLALAAGLAWLRRRRRAT
jgi:uncharacterized protein (TIGR03382 family)